MKTVVLYFADIFGRPGRNAVRAALPDLVASYTPDFVIGNVENLAGGRGVNRKTYNEMVDMGFHILTSGNHIWDNKEVLPLLESDSKLLRPANFLDHPDHRCPGKGWGVFHSGSRSLTVINLMGKVFMDPQDCPFATADRILKEVPANVPVFVDMHADATSEKTAMGWHLDGRVAAVVGSHSHVQTADERILPKGTAYITDVGLTGSWDSVIGLAVPQVLKKFLTRRPHKTELATGNPGICCVVVEIERTRAKTIERLRFPVTTPGLEHEGNLE